MFLDCCNNTDVYQEINQPLKCIPVVKLSASNYRKIRPRLIPPKRTFVHTHTRTFTNDSHTYVLGMCMNFVINVLARQRGGRGEGLNRYTQKYICRHKRARKKYTGFSNKSGRVSLHTFHPAYFSPTATALFAGPPSLCSLLSRKGYKLLLVSLFLTSSCSRAVPFLSPRRGAIVLTSIFYISLQPLNALTADIASNNRASRGISHARARHVQAVSIREYDTT